MKTIEILRKKLLGKFYSRFSIGDSYHFSIYDFFLIAQNVTSRDEEKLNELIFSEYEIANSAIDKEDISKAVIISATQRQVITDVILDNSSVMSLKFENGVILSFLTNTEIVDWHWAINRTGLDPYNDYEIACFEQGKVLLSDNKEERI